jgi:hypothetical protein
MTKRPIHPLIARELAKARKQFKEAAAKDRTLALLSLVDPIQAFADARVKLSAETRKYLRRNYPQFHYGDTRLYRAVREGRTKIPWVKKVRVI